MTDLLGGLADLEAEPPPSTPDRLRRGLALATTLLLLAGGLAAVLQGRHDQPADSTLAEITAFVADGRTVHVDGVEEWSTQSGRDDLGSETKNRSRLVADLRLPHDIHLGTDDGDALTELISIGSTSYFRAADGEAALEAED